MFQAEILHSNITSAISGTLFGAFVTFFGAKVANKTARLRYSIGIERIAIAAEDAVFGSVRVTWGNAQSMRNLYLVTLEVENTSSRDFENVGLKVYCATNTQLLSERTSVVDSPYIVEWSPEFSASLAIPTGELPSEFQINTYRRTREYRMPVLNRGQFLHFSYLCTCPNDDNPPGVFLSAQLKSARLVLQSRRNLIHGIPVQIAIIYGLMISLMTVLICSYFLHSTRAVSIICVVVGLFAQSFGAAGYKVCKTLWNMLAG